MCVLCLCDGQLDRVADYTPDERRVCDSRLERVPGQPRQSRPIHQAGRGRDARDLVVKGLARVRVARDRGIRIQEKRRERDAVVLGRGQTSVRGVISADAVGYRVETDRQRPLLCGRERYNRGHALVAGNLAGRVEQHIGGHGPLKVFRGR